MKGGDPSSPTAKWEYHCTFCGARVLWEWKRHWTPASSVALLLGGAPVVYAFWWAGQMALSYAGDLAQRPSGATVIGAFVLLCVAVTAAVMAFRLLWEWRQECPRCGVRVG
jgi:hypothetical protein